MDNVTRRDRLSCRGEFGRPSYPLSVAVLVDLEYGASAGGHVKCWQRFAEAAVGLEDAIELTVYFLGTVPRRILLSRNVRYEILEPRLGTRHIGFLSQGAGHTDLAPFHPGLARRLPQYDLLHVTDVFAFARTAAFVSRYRRIPLVMSIHTDLPYFTKVYTEEIVHRVFGDNRFANLVLQDLRFAARSADRMRQRVHHLARRCDHVLYAHDEDLAALTPVIGPRRLSHLRRGIDKERFHPRSRDRSRLESVFGIPPSRLLLLFVGRLDESKQVMLAARVARQLLERGCDLTFLAIGDGAQRHRIASMLGSYAVLPGSLPQSDLEWIYPSADLFVFPSPSETVGNVVLEAKASGLPVMVANCPGPSQLIRQSGWDGFVVPSGDVRQWTDYAEALLRDDNRRARIGARARRGIEKDWPSWEDVLETDLMQTWGKVVARAAPARSRSDTGSNSGFGDGLQNA